MNHLEAWIHGRTAIDIGHALLDSLWQGVIVAAALAALLAFTRSSAWRYAMACCALIAVAASPVVTFARLHTAVTTVRAPSAGVLPAAPVTNAAAEHSSALPRLDLQRVLPWITPVWLLGVLFFGLRQLAGLFSASRMCRVGCCPAPVHWQQRLDDLRRRIGVCRSVQLMESGMAQVPMLIGQLRPAVLIPAGLLTGLPVEQVEMILMHELAHIRRWDYAANVVQTLIENLMFFNPAVLWISKVIRTEREHCCDDRIVRVTADARGYAAALIALEEGRTASGATVAATGGVLVKRIRRILYPAERQYAMAGPVVLAGVLLAVTSLMLGARSPAVSSFAEPVTVEAVTSPAMAAEPSVSRAAPSPKPPVRRTALPAPARQEPSAALRRWLDEDVAYIVNDQERAAFRSLQNDDEREQFIRQFWLRRDPTPGTAFNELQDEHYRRVAYSNQKFTSTAGTTGWKTDRGRIYISWGPPDELESHPEGGAFNRAGFETRRFPFEVWLYRHIEGVGSNLVLEFVDPSGSAEFPLESPIIGDLSPVAVTGAVVDPGVFKISGQKFLLDVLGMAQGWTNDAVQIQVVRRTGRQTRTISVPELAGGRRDLNIPIFPGDAIHVSR